MEPNISLKTEGHYPRNNPFIIISESRKQCSTSFLTKSGFFFSWFLNYAFQCTKEHRFDKSYLNSRRVLNPKIKEIHVSETLAAWQSIEEGQDLLDIFSKHFKKLKEVPISTCIHRVEKHNSWKICEIFILHPIRIKIKHSKKKSFKNCKYDLLASLSQVYKIWQYIPTLTSDCESQVCGEYSLSC